MIPTQLQNTNLRFCKIRKDDKRPFEPNWHKNGYQWNDQNLMLHIASGGNYGVIGGYANLIVLDFDSIDAYEKARKFLPRTFSVITANKKLPHLYYFCSGWNINSPKSMKFCDDKKNTLIDVQGEGKQVVGPGSKIGQNEYKVWLDVPIVMIDYYNLKKLLNELFLQMDTVLPPKKQMPTIRNYSMQHGVFDEVSIVQILNKLGVKVTSKTHSNCPMHSSVGEKCLNYTDNKWYCFHCGMGGYSQNLIMAAKKCSWKEARDWLIKEFNLK